MTLQRAYERMPVRDGGFVKDFQSTEFNTRMFELFTSELLLEAGADFEVHGKQPDFEAIIGKIAFTLECVTVNPTKEDGAAPVYRAGNPRDADLDDLRDRVINDVPTRFGGALYTKRNRRFTKKDLAYWELPHTRDKPFLFAVQTFHEDGALDFSASALTSYLYGIVQMPAWDDAGNLVISQRRAPDHIKTNGERIPSAFYDYPGVDNIAGVLWANTGTAQKFLRMGLQGLFPDPEVAAFRVGSASDPHPNAHAPQVFAYEVGPTDEPEPWGEGCILFHNPNALNPLPRDLLTNVVNGYRDEQGRYVEDIPAGIHPFMSRTVSGYGEQEIAAAERAVALYYAAFKGGDPAAEVARRSAAWWSGFSGEGPETRYRSDSLSTP